MTDYVRPFTLAAVGDLQLGDSSICVGFGFCSRFADVDLNSVFADAAPRWAGVDLMFGNLETTLSSIGLIPDRWDSAQMRGLSRFGRQLRQAGFTVLNVANNHAVQHGTDAFQETVGILREAGIAPCGIRGGGDWCSEPVIVTGSSGSKLGVLGYCHRPRQYGTVTPPYAEGSLDAMLADVARLRPMVNHVAVSLHWGEEFVALPSQQEVHQARTLIEGGASVILGHHPHVLRPVEWYRSGLIAYSLGNFVGDMVWHEPLRKGAVLGCTLGDGCVLHAELTETYVDAGFIPRMLSPSRPIRADLPGPNGLDEASYQDAIGRTIRAQRRAAYGYALRNLGRFRPRLLAQLARVTIQNKLAAMVPGRENPGE